MYDGSSIGMRAARLETVVPLHAVGARRSYSEHGVSDVDAGPGRRGRLLQHPGVSYYGIAKCSEIFTCSPQRPSSYEVGGPEYARNIIVDCFGAGRLEEYRGKHKLDLCLVYGAEPWALSPAPGGRDNAVMVTPLLLFVR